MLFLANFRPSTPCHTLPHIPGPPKSTSHISDLRFLVGLVQKTGQKPPVKFSLNCSRGLLSGGFCLAGFVQVGFCLFPLLSEYICYNRKLKTTLNFMFHMYDKKIYKRDITCS